MGNVVTPYYEHGGITIYHGDCMEILPTLDDAELGFADPPYNYGIDYGPEYSDDMPAVEYVAWCADWFSLLRAQTSRTCVTPGHGNMLQWLERRPSGVAAWHKPGNPSGAGIFQFCEWEPVFVWGGGRIGGSDVWRATTNPNFKGSTGHPCPKPELLMRRIILAFKAKSVIDPFMGSGTTLRAAKDLGIPAIGIDVSERYCEIAATRLAQQVLAL